MVCAKRHKLSPTSPPLSLRRKPGHGVGLGGFISQSRFLLPLILLYRRDFVVALAQIFRCSRTGN
jgi:hypothetical protein